MLDLVYGETSSKLFGCIAVSQRSLGICDSLRIRVLDILIDFISIAHISKKTTHSGSLGPQECRQRRLHVYAGDGLFPHTIGHVVKHPWIFRVDISFPVAVVKRLDCLS
jgi:hypothetical protein